MRSSLTLIDRDGRVGTHQLRGAEVVIGRDPDCAVHVHSELASWSHACIKLVDGRYVLFDLGSTNGTSVNGNPVSVPTLLRDGDSIVIAGEVELIYREGAESEPATSGGAVRIIAAAAAAVMLLAGIVSWVALNRDDPRDPRMDAAVALAEKGITAARSGDQLAARDALRAAAGQLYTNGYLDDVPRGDLQREAMRLLQDRIDVSFDLWSFYDNVLHQAQAPRKVDPKDTRGRCRLDSIDSDRLEPCLQQWIEHVLLEIRQEIESIPPEFHRAVGRRLLVENDFLRASFRRGERMVPMLKKELEAAKMPPLLHYVALIESGYKNSATSTVAAAGVWQFMPATGRQYGLRVDGRVDERREPEKATRAAARYLRDLAFEFGGDALLLALAGYNRGENGVRRSLKKLEDPFSDRSYWRLVERDLLPDETQSYVPRFIAAAVAGEGGLPSKQTLLDAGY